MAFRFQSTRMIFLSVATAALVSCGGGGGNGGPSAPTPTIPNVVGNYSGSATITLPELQQSQTCPASTSVTQSGSTVNIAPIILAGQCNNLSIPFGQATIDNTGAITGNNSGTFNEPSCGTYSYTASGGFFGRELRMSATASSSTCYNFNFTAVLTR